MQGSSWTLWSSGDRRGGARCAIIQREFGARHLVDLDIVSWEDAAPVCSRDPAFKPLVINLSTYADHLTLNDKTRRRITETNVISFVLDKKAFRSNVRMTFILLFSVNQF